MRSHLPFRNPWRWVAIPSQPIRRCSGRLGLGLPLASALLLAAGSRGAETAWLLPNPGSFLDPSAWSSGTPDAATQAIFGVGSSAEPFDVSFPGDAIAFGLRVTNQSPRFLLAGHTLNLLAGPQSLVIGGPPPTPSVRFEGGTVHANETWIGSPEGAGMAILDGTELAGDILVIGAGQAPDQGAIHGGSLTLTGPCTIGPTGGIGILEVDGGSVCASPSVRLGIDPATSQQGRLTVRGPGTVWTSDTVKNGSGTLEAVDGGAIQTSHTSVVGSTFPHVFRSRGAGSTVALGLAAPQGRYDLSAEDGGVIGVAGLTLNPSSTLHVSIGPHGAGLVNNYGNLARAGTLSITFEPGYLPAPGSVIPIVQSAVWSGQFAVVETPALGGEPCSVLLAGSALVLIVPSASVSLDIQPASISVPVGFSMPVAVSAIIEPDGIPAPLYSGVGWASSDPKVAIVDASNRVHALTAGEATATAVFGQASATLAVNAVPLVDPWIRRASESADGVAANADAAAYGDPPAISGDGRFVAFASLASNLVPGDGNGRSDVFVKDTQTGAIEMVSVASDGTPSNGDSTRPVISADGRIVVFHSRSTNLAPGALSLGSQIAHDRLTGETRLVSATTDGTSFGASWDRGAIDATGRFVAFVGVPEPQPSGGIPTAVRKDLATGELAFVARTVDGLPAFVTTGSVAISDDGQRVAFGSGAHILPDSPSSPIQGYLRDLSAETTTPFTRRTDGTWANGALQACALDGHARHIVMLTTATNLAPGTVDAHRDLIVFDRLTGSFTQGNTTSTGEEASDEVILPSLSSSGRYLVFASMASNLVPEPGSVPRMQVYRKDLRTGMIELVSLGPVGSGDLDSDRGTSTSAEGDRIAFGSEATNLVAFDTNGKVDTVWTTMPTPAPEDLDDDGEVGGGDLAILLAAWGSSDYWADLDQDGVVGASDLATLLGAWGQR